MSAPGKVFASILNHRVHTVTEDKIMEKQAGFRRGRGCAEQIFVMRQLTEKMIEKGKKLCAVFVDLEKAYGYAGRSCGKLCGGMVCPVVY